MRQRNASALKGRHAASDGTIAPDLHVVTSAVPGRRRGRQPHMVLAPLMIILASLVVLLSTVGGAFKGGPSGLAFEADFAMFISAARITEQGGNPYDHTLLLRTDQAMLSGQHLPLTKEHALVRVGNPPLFFWLLEPLTRFRFQAVAFAWMVFMCMASVLGFLAALRYLGWKKWLVPVLVFALMPQVLLGPYYGNVICLVFAGIGLALASAKRHPVTAGVLLTLALLKPPVALPIALLVVLFHPGQRTRILIGFGVTTAALCILTVFALGWNSLSWWMSAMVGYSNNVKMWPDMVSLSGLYVRTTGAHTRLALEVLCLTVATGLTLKAWWDTRSRTEPPLFLFAWLSFVWLLATPYAHPFDEVLLAVPMLILLGRDGYRITWRWPAWSLYLMSFSILLFPAAPHNFQLLPLPLLVTALCVHRAGSNPRYGEGLDPSVDAPRSAF
jgi:hypothetical protein